MAKLKYNQLNIRKYESHWLVTQEVKPKAKVLDIGCATGYIAQELQKKSTKVWGIEVDRYAAEKAKEYMEHVYVTNVNGINRLNIKKNYFDYILLLDVIEHLTDREEVLKNIKKYLNKNGKLIISTPNIAHISVRLFLLQGKFDYTETGILDKTHVHFFTQKTLKNILMTTRYKIERIEYSSDFGQVPYLGRFLRHFPKKIQYTITKLLPDLLAVQFIAICKVK